MSERGEPAAAAGDAAHARFRQRTLGVTDQVVSSLTNLTSAVLAARVLSVEAFGRYSIVAAVALALIALSRVATSDPLTLSHAADPYVQRLRHSSMALAVACTFGAAAGTVTTVLLALSNYSSAFAMAISAALVGVVVQDCLRFALVMQQRAGWALLSDAVWMCLSVGLWILFGSSVERPEHALLIWLVPGAVAGLPAVTSLRMRASWRIRSWLRKHRHIVRPQLGQFLVGAGTSYLMVPIVGAIAGIGAAAVVRIAQLASNPYNVVAQGLYLTYVPQLVREAQDTPLRLHTGAVRLSRLLVLCALANALAVTLVPESLAVSVLGESWSGSRTAVAILAWQSLPVAMAAGAVAAVSAGGWLRDALRLRVAVSIATLMCVCLGAALGGATGSVVGLLAASTVVAPWWWLLLRRRVDGAPAIAR